MSNILLCECGFPMTSDGQTMSTLVGYFSPPGHNHDDNCQMRLYKCANDHRRAISKQNKCPAPGCEWVGKLTCFCHEGEKFKLWPDIQPGE